MTTVTIRSNKAPQPNQKHRSSNNFSTADFPENATLTFKTFYDYGTSAQREATDILFDVKIDKSGTDPTLLQDVFSGATHKNTSDRNLYIANPRHAMDTFTVVVSF